ncbi:uncharacterized protein LOC109602056 isoform X2 [Aethina tumida]|uniref:uncharacterized protein LOC109602056 isoform X2 n=1 Tax=Aethina tumida TaxID=116153 RepID=UPI0021498E3D|nr:uncharacterized protein LOC109602056 isoform X2 [Aethina tumida]
MNKSKNDVVRKMGEDQIYTVKEPVRVTKCDLIEYQLKQMGRDFMGARQFFEDIYDNVNSQYCEDPLTGFLIYYPKIFIILVEGSHLSLSKHFSDILKNLEVRFSKVKMFLYISNINQRFNETWDSYTGTAPSRREKFDPEADLSSTMFHLKCCIRKLYSVYLNYNEEQLNKSIPKKASEIRMLRQSTTNLPSTVSILLPENELLDFLLKSRHLQDFKYFCYMWNTPCPLDQTRDCIWPYPSRLTATNILSEDYDIVCELPKFKRSLFDSKLEIITRKKHSSNQKWFTNSRMIVNQSLTALKYNSRKSMPSLTTTN